MSKGNRTKTRRTRRTRKRKNNSSRHATQGGTTRTRSNRQITALHSRNDRKRSRLEPEPLVISDSDASEKSEQLAALSTSHPEVSVMTAYQSSTSESGYDHNTSQDTLFGIPDIGHFSDAHFSDSELFKAEDDDDDWFGWADNAPSRVPVLHVNDVLSRVESPDTEEEEEEESEGRVRARWQCLRASEQCTVAAVAAALRVQRMTEEQRQEKHRFSITPPGGKSFSASVAHASRGGKETPMVSVNGRRVRLSAETIRDGDAPREEGEGGERVCVRHKNTVYQMQVIEEL